MTRVCMLSSVHHALDNRIFYREARTLRRAGYEVTVVAVHDRDETRDGITIRALPEVRRIARPLVWPRLVRIARDVDADVYHFHDPELLTVAPLLRHGGATTVYDVHEANADLALVKDYVPRFARRTLSRLIAEIEPRLARRNAAIVTADDDIATTFGQLSVPVVTLWNFPGDRLLDDAASRRSGTEPVVLYLGGIERNRGTSVMVEALARVRAEIGDARLVMVGRFSPPELEREVVTAATRLGVVDALEIVGPVPFDEVGDYYGRAAVGWVPWQSVAKNRKNVPTKLFEYLAYGLPVVASDLPSTRRFLDERCGILVDPADPVAHAAAIVGLLRDPEKARELGAHGRQLVHDSYSWERMEHRLVELYRSLVPPEDAPPGGMS